MVVFLPGILYAAELPMTEQLFFKSQLKEYACKIIDPSLRHENSQLATLDIKNLQEKIFIKLKNSEEHLKIFKKFIIENIWTAKVFSSFKKDLLDKQKFEYLNNIPHEIIDFSDLNNIEPLNAKANIILFDKFLYKSSFNSTINMPKSSEKQPQTYVSASKNLEQEYYEITRDTQNITDEESLKKYGPPVIERSEKILFGNDDSLRLDYASNLIYYAGICRILLKHGMNLPEATKRKYLLEYSTINIYEKVPLYNYKYAAFLFNLNILEADKKYDDMLAFALKVKKEIYEQLIIDLKYDLVFKINYLIVYFCETKPERFEIGKENCYLLINLVDFINSPYYPTSEHKRVLKLTYTFRFTAELYAKYKYYNEAIYELDFVITSPPPVIIPTIRDLAETHRELVAEAKKRKLELIPYMTVVTLSFKGETLKKVYAYQNDNIYELILNIDSKSKAIPKNLSIEFTFTSIFEDVDKFMADNKFKLLRGKENEYGFIDDNGKITNTLKLTNITDTSIKLRFKFTNYGGDLFTINAKALVPYPADSSTQVQVWKKVTLRLYGMKDPKNEKDLYPKISDDVKKIFASAYIHLQEEHHPIDEVTIPHHTTIFFKKIDGYNEKDFIKSFYNELKNAGLIFEQSRISLNIIGIDTMTVDGIYDNPNGFYGFDLKQYITDEKKSPFHSILLAYRQIKSKETKTFTHELIHSLGIGHPDNNFFAYPHDSAQKCAIYPGSEHDTDFIICDNCMKLIKNNYPNIDLGEFVNMKTARK